MTLPTSIEIPEFAPRLIDIVVINDSMHRYMDVYVLKPLTFKGEARLLALYADELVSRKDGVHLVACRDLDEFLYDCKVEKISTHLVSDDWP